MSKSNKAKTVKETKVIISKNLFGLRTWNTKTDAEKLAKVKELIAKGQLTYTPQEMLKYAADNIKVMGAKKVKKAKAVKADPAHKQILEKTKAIVSKMVKADKSQIQQAGQYGLSELVRMIEDKQDQISQIQADIEDLKAKVIKACK